MPSPELNAVKGKDNCWICEGWTEGSFELRSPIFGGEVLIHFEFEKYKGDLVKQKMAGIYKTNRMIPPGVHRYYYSFNGEQMVSGFEP